MKATSVGQVVAALVKAMDEKYRDHTKPGVLISYVDYYFYVAVKRYDQSPSGRNVVVRTGTNLFDTVKDVAKSWLQSERPANSARQELEDLLK